jgi:hypothetical protein
MTNRATQRPAAPRLRTSARLRAERVQRKRATKECAWNRKPAVWRPADKKLTRDLVMALLFAEHAARQVIARYGEPVETIYTDPRWEPPPYLKRKQVTVITDPRKGEPRPATKRELARARGF